MMITLGSRMTNMGKLVGESGGGETEAGVVAVLCCRVVLRCRVVFALSGRVAGISAANFRHTDPMTNSFRARIGNQHGMTGSAVNCR